MDFFAHQEQARKRTTLLVTCYGIAVAAITLGVYALFVFTLATSQDKLGQTAALSWWHPELFVATLLFVPGLILAGTLFKTLQLNRGGGASVARMLGGSPVPPDTQDPAERRLLNVVEEMAIASGVPVPAVYVLTEENGVNAFAAGYSPRDAVIGVTRGCLKNLSRDELQGVIAHEFSHIVHGDMRLNIRLMGVLFGIIMITLVGRILLRTVYFSGGSRRSGRGGGKKGSNPLPFIGIGLMVIGYIGVFFANIIKSAVSRQREYLADAAAIQFTRNPGGLAGALQRIRSLSLGSRVGNVRASEAGHLFFGDCSKHMVSLFATHPPLDTRIQRIDPHATWTPEPTASPHATGSGTPHSAAAADETASSPGILEEEDHELAGVVHLAAAQAILQNMPSGLEQATHDPTGARALFYALLWSGEPSVQHTQREILAANDTQALAVFDQYLTSVQALQPTMRLPLAERLLPALRSMPPQQYPRFRRAVHALTEADSEINLFEFTIRSMTTRHLDTKFSKVDRAPIKYRNLEKVQEPIGTVLSALALWGTEGDQVAVACFQAGLQPLQMDLQPSQSVSLPAVEQALEKLSHAAPFIKRRVMEACKATILQDRRVGPNQYELLRAVADAMDVPMPPLSVR